MLSLTHGFNSCTCITLHVFTWWQIPSSISSTLDMFRHVWICYCNLYFYLLMASPWRCTSWYACSPLSSRCRTPLQRFPLFSISSFRFSHQICCLFTTSAFLKCEKENSNLFIAFSGVRMQSRWSQYWDGRWEVIQISRVQFNWDLAHIKLPMMSLVADSKYIYMPRDFWFLSSIVLSKCSILIDCLLAPTGVLDAPP